MYTPCELQLREAEEGEESRLIRGYAILFDSPSIPLYKDTNGSGHEVISRDAITMDLLDKSDIKMTMFHDRQLLLARSRNGEGTLSYGIDERGVWFEFNAPHTTDGDKAVELVKRGDLAGCSFAFSTYYRDEDYVSRKRERDADGTTHTTYTVKKVLGVYDFTLTDNPVYPATSVNMLYSSFTS